MLAWLRPPELDSDERTQRARTFHQVASLTIAISNLCFLVLALTRPALHERLLAYVLGVDLPTLLLLALNRRGRTRLASGLFVVSLVLLITLGALRAGGIRSPGVGMYFVFVLIAGLLLGHRAGVTTAIACSCLGLGLVALELLGQLPERTVEYDAPTLWGINAIYMALVLFLVRGATRTVTSALQRAEAELRERRAAERERERLITQLRERVAELKLLHATAQLLQRDRPFEPAVLEQLVALIPAGFMRGERCEARITYRELDAHTPGWRESRWLLRESFAASAGKGAIEVAYPAPPPSEADGAFPSDERALLRSLVEMLVAYLDYNDARAQRHELERQLRHAQKLDALGQLAGGIAHDFNNILMAMSFNIDLALAELPARTGAHDYLDEVQRAQSRAQELVKQILLFARKQESERAVLELAPVVQEALELLRATLPANVQVRFSCEPDLPHVLADPGQIHQVMMNLGTNAGFAMNEHGGVLSVDLTAATLVERASASCAGLAPGRYVCLAVRDTGTGMSNEVLERLFEPFFTTKGPRGTGLGLSVVHGIVRDHRGGIVASSELGRGSVFRIYLPAHERGAALSKPDATVALRQAGAIVTAPTGRL